jgi:hypothetical protein
MTVYGMYVFETIEFLEFKLNDLKWVADNHDYNTRNQNEIVLDSYTLELYKEKPTYMGTKFYNKLPKDKIGKRSKRFKNKLKKISYQQSTI